MVETRVISQVLAVKLALAALLPVMKRQRNIQQLDLMLMQCAHMMMQ